MPASGKISAFRQKALQRRSHPPRCAHRDGPRRTVDCRCPRPGLRALGEDIDHEHALALLLQRGPDNLLAVAGFIPRRGVDQVQAKIHRPVESADAFLKRNIPVCDVAEPDAGGIEAGSAQWSSCHQMLEAWLHAGPENGTRFLRAPIVRLECCTVPSAPTSPGYKSMIDRYRRPPCRLVQDLPRKGEFVSDTATANR